MHFPEKYTKNDNYIYPTARRLAATWSHHGSLSETKVIRNHRLAFSPPDAIFTSPTAAFPFINNSTVIHWHWMLGRNEGYTLHSDLNREWKNWMVQKNAPLHSIPKGEPSISEVMAEQEEDKVMVSLNYQKAAGKWSEEKQINKQTAKGQKNWRNIKKQRIK